MKKYILDNDKDKGILPGALVNEKPDDSDEVRVSVFNYNKSAYQEKVYENIEEFSPERPEDTISWINIDGPRDYETISEFAGLFNIHGLVLEDLLERQLRPRLEDYDHYIYITLKMLYLDKSSSELNIEQVSFLLTEGAVISFQEKTGDTFDVLRNKIRKSIGRVRKQGADYLLYDLIDSVVDNYFMVLENMGQRIEELEEELLSNPSKDLLIRIHMLKREMVMVRKYVLPLMEMALNLKSSESRLIRKSTRIFMKDLHNHCRHIAETIESYRDMVTAMLDTYLSLQSNKQNEVMKVLTIIASIFIPLNLIAGIYGMNFEYMPELHFVWGYPAVLVVMLAIAGGMLYYFRTKKWI